VHRQGLAGPNSELIQPRKFHYGLRANARIQQPRNPIAVGEGLVLSSRQAHQLDAIRIRQSGLPRLDQLRYLISGQVVTAELIHAAEPHSGLIERREIRGLLMFASGERRKRDKRRGTSHEATEKPAAGKRAVHTDYFSRVRRRRRMPRRSVPRRSTRDATDALEPPGD